MRDFDMHKTTYFKDFHYLLRVFLAEIVLKLFASQTLSSAEAPYGKFLNNVGFGRARGERWDSLHALRAAVFSLSPGLRPKNIYGQSSTKEASAEERASQIFQLFLSTLELNILKATHITPEITTSEKEQKSKRVSFTIFGW